MWIDVKDKLPNKTKFEESEKVLVVMEGFYHREVTTSKYNHKQGFWSTRCGTEKITHWQELPKPPKK